MANYIYYEFADLQLSERFSFSDSEDIRGIDSGDIQGLDLWRDFIGLLERITSEGGEVSGLDLLLELLNKYPEILPNNILQSVLEQNSLVIEKILQILLLKLRSIESPSKRNCPRLFVSHRQPDWLYALRIAQLARSEKFEYWVDILDPSLKALALYSSKHAPNSVSLLTACIIEMALINCTHVIACMTPNSRGTMWQPYEYGRVTKIPVSFGRACAWIHPGLPAKDFPEYMLLGEVTENEDGIIKWLEKERKKTMWIQCPEQLEVGEEILDLPQLPEYEDIQHFPVTIIIIEDGFTKTFELKNQASSDIFIDGLIIYLTTDLSINQIDSLLRFNKEYYADGMPLTKPLIIKSRPPKFKKRN